MTARRVLKRREMTRRTLRALVIAGGIVVAMLCIPVLIAKTFVDAKGVR
ncbi:hypothetical protein [Sphingomonas desiccabilis]|nr:hypothetical protein [Sphingomonas desiccabilis]MBB3910508.1 hypothetical protein [Sphingomonas desiccabilis]